MMILCRSRISVQGSLIRRLIWYSKFPTICDIITSCDEENNNKNDKLHERDRVPVVKFKVLAPYPHARNADQYSCKEVTSDELFAGKRVILFASDDTGAEVDGYRLNCGEIFTYSFAT